MYWIGTNKSRIHRFSITHIYWEKPNSGPENKVGIEELPQTDKACVFKSTGNLLRSNNRRECFPLKISNKTKILTVITSTQYYTEEYSHKTMKKKGILSIMEDLWLSLSFSNGHHSIYIENPIEI